MSGSVICRSVRARQVMQMHIRLHTDCVPKEMLFCKQHVLGNAPRMLQLAGNQMLGIVHS